MKTTLSVLDAYRRYARRHPLRFIGINIILVVLWITVIMRFSGENADISGNRSARILVGIVNTIAPKANVTLDNYESVEALHNSEKVVRKVAHMIEYGILTCLLWALFFGFRNLPRKYAYILPVVFVFFLGMIDEKNQTTIDGRYGSWFDVGVDVLASVITVYLAYRLTKRYRKRKTLEIRHAPSGASHNGEGEVQSTQRPEQRS